MPFQMWDSPCQTVIPKRPKADKVCVPHPAIALRFMFVCVSFASTLEEHALVAVLRAPFSCLFACTFCVHFRRKLSGCCFRKPTSRRDAWEERLTTSYFLRTYVQWCFRWAGILLFRFVPGFVASVLGCLCFCSFLCL